MQISKFKEQLARVFDTGNMAYYLAKWAGFNYISKVFEAYPDAQRLLGTLYAKGRGVVQDYAKAVEWYTKAAEQGVARAYNGLAWTFHLLGRYDEALPWAEKAVEAQPDDANVLDTLDTVHQGLGRLDEALAEFRRCLELKEAAGAAAVLRQCTLTRSSV